MNRPTLVFAILVLASATASAKDETGSPLPPAPLRLVIPDVPAFDAALGGGFRDVLTGAMDAEDPVLRAWRQTQVGSKLEAQWSAFSSDLPWTWNDILATRARSLGMAFLSAASLEIVLVLDTPLATLPVPLPTGSPATHKGQPYALVTRGAGDGGTEDRRAGFAWARVPGRLILATSEHAMRLTLDEVAAGRGFAAPLPGLASLDLDLDVLSKDLYFRREFLFETAGTQGHVRAALRVQDGHIVEVREGQGKAGGAAFAFDVPEAVASGWESDTSRLRAENPVPPLAPLPSPGAEVTDRYLVDMTRPAVVIGAPWEKGDLAAWEALLPSDPSSGWGWAIRKDRSRSLVFLCPTSTHKSMDDALVATLERRAGKVAVSHVGDITEYRVGPALLVLATRRTGEFLWIATSRAALESVGEPRAADGLLRWAKLETSAVRQEAETWARAEGPASPDRSRPFSDRLLGLLGWMPDTQTITVERRKSGAGWTEQVVFGRSIGR
jgi:hypothetical protein